MALKIVYKICCGIDVHKTFVVVCIASTNHKDVTTYESHRFSTYTSGLKNLLHWLLVRVDVFSSTSIFRSAISCLSSFCSYFRPHPHNFRPRCRTAIRICDITEINFQEYLK